jgi:hypothetical protein
LLPLTPSAGALIKRLLASGLIPAVAQDDAVHIGIAAAHGMDYLLTWNCRHINNHHLRARIERACASLGLACPDICSPGELMES